MKILKLLIVQVFLISFNLVGMKAPGKPTKLPAFLEMIQKEERSQQARQDLVKIRNEQMATLQGLPADLQRYLISFIALDTKTYADVIKLAQTIIALAETNRALRATMNSPQIIITIFNLMPYTANALSLAKLLQKKPGSLPVMQSAQIKKWLSDAESRLTGGRELIIAIKNNNFDRVREFLKNKNLDFDRFIFIKMGFEYERYRSALYQALLNDNSTGNTNFAKILLAAGANPNILDPSTLYPFFPLLQFALSFDNRSELISLLLAAGANPNMQNERASSPLIHIIEGSRRYGIDTKRIFEIIQILLAAGADPNLKDSQNHTARGYALEKNMPEIVKLLDEAAKEREKRKAQQTKQAKK